MGVVVIYMDAFSEIYEGQKVCCTCAHYAQHYRKSNRGYSPVDCGHCSFPRVKNRKPDQTCEYWKPIGENKEKAEG